MIRGEEGSFFWWGKTDGRLDGRIRCVMMRDEREREREREKANSIKIVGDS